MRKMCNVAPPSDIAQSNMVYMITMIEGVGINAILFYFLGGGCSVGA